jgi:ABC-2 type transport system permease protein
MSRVLLLHTWRSQWIKLAAVAAGLSIWGFLMPVIYATFGADLRDLLESGVFPRQFSEFGEGDVFSLSGSIALGFIHPIALVLISVFAVGFTSGAVAGERQRGTLEVLLARPLSRRVAYGTLLLATALFIGIAVAAILAGSMVGATLFGVIDEIDIARMPLVWLNGVLLFGAIASIGLAASVSFDRLTPALGITLAVTIVSYFLEILGSLWPDAEALQPYSLFHYLKPKMILAGDIDAFGFGLLTAIVVGGIVYSLAVFPRRDLAAPA